MWRILKFLITLIALCALGGQLQAQRLTPTELRPVLIDLGPFSLKGRAYELGEEKIITATQIMDGQSYLKIELDGRSFELQRTQGGVHINGLKGCVDIIFHAESLSCTLDNGPELKLNFDLELIGGSELNQVLEQEMILCQAPEELTVSAQESEVLGDLLYLRREIEALKAQGVSVESGLYLQQNLIEERERVLTSLLQSWAQLDQEKYQAFERSVLRKEIEGAHLQTNYLSCPVHFAYNAKGCDLLAASALLNQQESMNCASIRVYQGALWCDEERLDFNSSCLLGLAQAKAIGPKPLTPDVFDGAREQKKMAAPLVVPVENKGGATSLKN